MDFRVPQFIEHDPKILGPLTMTQSLYIGGATGGCFLLYFTNLPFSLYIMICGILFAAALALAFLKIEGFDLASVGKNLTSFSMNTKLYLWKRKESPVYLTSAREKRISENKKDLEEKSSVLKIKQQGKMGNLIKKIDFEK